jgi:predicted transcriptional regulator
MKYRSREEIIGSILRTASASQGANKTPIMFSSFLSYPQLEHYLESLISENLLECDSKNRVYRTSLNGLNFLELNNKITDLIRIPRRVVDHVRYH